MTKPLNSHAHPAVHTLVERLGAFLRNHPSYLEPTVPVAATPDDLAHVLDELGHHVTVLTLVARSDDNIAAIEREVIFRYCVQRAAKIGHPLTEPEQEALREYLSDFYPPLSLLEDALERLKFDSKADLEKLLEAAHEVIAADHVFRVDEVAFLLSLRHDLAAL
jgi:hypothetical protein